MSSIIQFYKLLAFHPGSFLDYSAWIALRSYKTSEQGPCPVNTEPPTEGLWIAKYVFDSLAEYLPETYIEHDISLSTFDASQLTSISSQEFSKLVYLVNRHLILNDNVDFWDFEKSVCESYKANTEFCLKDSGNFENSDIKNITDFQELLNFNRADENLTLFLILCLATHASYAHTILLFDYYTNWKVIWEDNLEKETSKRLVNMFERVFPSSLATTGDEKADNDTQVSIFNLRDNISSNKDTQEPESEPLLSASGEPNQDFDTHLDDENLDVFQIPMHKRETYLRVPLPKKNYKAERDWTALGFQGSNPTTDFRATGLLGLKFLENFCLSDPVSARNIMFESGSFNADLSKAWYSAALVSIHMTLFINRMLRGRFLHRGLPLNLNLQAIYKSLVSQYNNDIENIDYPGLLNEIQKQIWNAFYKLHNNLVIGYHKFWKNEVRQGIVKTPLEVDASIKRFQESIQYQLFDGKWEF